MLEIVLYAVAIAIFDPIVHPTQFIEQTHAPGIVATQIGYHRFGATQIAGIAGEHIKLR